MPMVNPSAIGIGSPGKIPLFSSSLNDRTVPSKIPIVEARLETNPKFISMLLTSIE